ncbi:MAG: type I DNA topoisomerase [Acidobacteria bacterium]|nr:type I DNA topoisomerase [Acidobacteriota bacterium]
MTKLVVVESPSKAKTINKYLGKDYRVMASIGHIKDLPEKSLGVDVKNNFEPTYQVIPDSKKKNNKKIVTELKSAAKDAEAIYLAADPDREGEAICQHLKEELTSRNKKPVYRVLFNEITKDAIIDAFKHSGQINSNKVDAQQARRVLDRLVGYEVSPLLCRKVGGKLSAGRVQSVALRLVAEREREIISFKPTEYWTITANLSADKKPNFDSKLYKVTDKLVKTGDFDKLKKTEVHITNAQEAKAIVDEAGKENFVVSSITTKERKRNPVPPFITSKLQQEAARKLHFPVRKTMQVAQKLYEGVELENGETVGLITYMRTDSTRVSDSALEEVRSFIGKQYGVNYLPKKANSYGNKKGSQDAHEAIRPTSIQRTPDSLAKVLSKDELGLYKLIWQRFVASQMNPAIFDETIVDVNAGAKYIFRAKGAVLRFDGFLVVYVEGKDEKDDEDEELALRLPIMKEGQVLKLNKITPEQNFTKPPAKFTEATLVKALEEKGIGRPSTYAQIIFVILSREYVKKEEGKFTPTELGLVVNDVLVQNFKELFDVSYTAAMEQQLDEIEEGNLKWKDAISKFYTKFSVDLATAEKNITRAKEGILTEETCTKCSSPMALKLGRFGPYLSCTNQECKATRDPASKTNPASSNESGENGASDEPCENCGKPMALKKGRWGQFYACTGYPDCKTTRKIAASTMKKADVPLEALCPQCNKHLALKQGRFGEFVACSNYPECKYIKQDTTGVKCPTDGCNGEIVVRKSKKGKVFYGCNRYPTCKNVYWDKPIAESCPNCSATLLFEKFNKRDGQLHYCAIKECNYRKVISAPESDSLEQSDKTRGHKQIQKAS